MTDQGHPLAGPHFVVSTDGELHAEDTPENREIARRIRACVNACEGISTEELEQGIIQDMRRALASVVPLLQANNHVPPTPQPSRSIVVNQARTTAQSVDGL
jgi:hypothetical protein